MVAIGVVGRIAGVVVGVVQYCAPIGHDTVDGNRCLCEQTVVKTADAIRAEVEIEDKTEVLIGDVSAGDVDGERASGGVLELPVYGRCRRAVGDEIVVIDDDRIAAIGDVRQRVRTGVGIRLYDLDDRAAGDQLDPGETDAKLAAVECVIRIDVVIDVAGDVRTAGALHVQQGCLACGALMRLRGPLARTRHEDDQGVAARPGSLIYDFLNDGGEIGRALIQSCIAGVIPRRQVVPGHRGDGAARHPAG